MAIIKKAKNLYITIDNKYNSNSKVFMETAEKIEIVAIEGDLKLISNKKINVKNSK